MRRARYPVRADLAHALIVVKSQLLQAHDPEIVASRSGRVDLHDHFSPAIAVNIAHSDRAGAVAQPRAVEVGLERVAPDRRHVGPLLGSRIEFHDPEIVAARSGGVDLDNHLGEPPSTSAALTERAALPRPEQSKSA